MKLLMALLMSLRKLFIKVGDKVMSLMRDPESGKIKFFDSPQQLKKVLMIAGVVLAMIIIAYQLTKGTDLGTDGAESFNKEIENKIGITSLEKDLSDDFSNPLENIRVMNENNPFRESYSPDLVDNRNEFGPTFEVCEELFGKLRRGDSLTRDERDVLKECLDKNVLELTPEELAIAEKLLDGGILNPDEIEALNNLFEDEPACQDEFDAQMQTSDGKEFLTRMLRDNQFRDKIIEILQDKTLLQRMETSPELFKERLNLNDEDWRVLNKLLNNCSPNLLVKLLSDPVLREALARVLEDGGSLNDLLNSEALTDAERELLEKYLAGELDDDSVEAQAARALLSSDPFKRQQAKDFLKARALGDKTLSDALGKSLMGEELTPTEQSLLDSLDSDKLDEAYRNRDNPALSDALLKQAKGLPLTPEEQNILDTAEEFDASLISGDGVDQEGLIKRLAEDVADRRSELEGLTEEQALAQAAARDAARKLQEGQPLSDEDQEALKRLTDLQDRIKMLKDQLEKRENELGRVYTSMQTAIYQAGATLRQVDPQGSITTEYDLPNCSTAQPFKIVKRVKRAKPKKPTGPKYVDEDGNPLSPEEIKLYELMRKERMAAERNKENSRRELLNPLDSSGIIGGSAVQGGTEQASSNINDLFVSENSDLKPFIISPSKPIGAMLMNQILVSDKGQGMLARVKILHDVYDSKTNKLAIPKGTIAQGRTTGFDADTGVMNLTLDKVFVGGDQIDVSFEVASADLKLGLRGQVRDTRGKLLIGTFISSFTSGALAAISQNFISPFQDSDVLGDSLIGAGLSGGAEVAQRVAELYAGDLQNAAKLFYVPANIPVVLYAND